DRVEGEVDAARQLVHLLDDITAGRRDGIRRAERAREVAAGGIEVDREHAARTGDAGALDDRQADSAAADDGNGGALGDSRRAQDGADAGGDAAAHEGEHVEGRVGVDRDR